MLLVLVMSCNYTSSFAFIIFIFVMRVPQKHSILLIYVLLYFAAVRVTVILERNPFAVNCSLNIHVHVGVITWTLLYTQIDQPMLLHFAQLFHVTIPGGFFRAHYLECKTVIWCEIHHAPSPWAVFSYKLVNFTTRMTGWVSEIPNGLPTKMWLLLLGGE